MLVNDLRRAQSDDRKKDDAQKKRGMVKQRFPRTKQPPDSETQQYPNNAGSDSDADNWARHAVVCIKATVKSKIFPVFAFSFHDFRFRRVTCHLPGQPPDVLAFLVGKIQVAFRRL